MIFKFQVDRHDRVYSVVGFVVVFQVEDIGLGEPNEARAPEKDTS